MSGPGLIPDNGFTQAGKLLLVEFYRRALG